jgi:hypothetical protein
MLAYLLILVDVCTINCATPQAPKLSRVRRDVEQIFCDLSFGQRQVEQIVCDQPDIGEILRRESVLRLTLIWNFAGGLKGNRVYWDCREPTSGQPAEHLMSGGNYPALVRVSSKGSASDKCASLLFELNNLAIDQEFQVLVTSVAEKRKSREDFATSCIRHEFDATKATQRYFREHPLAEVNFQNSPYYCSLILFSGDFSDYLKWLDSRNQNAFNPCDYYRQAYDKVLSAREH